MNAYEIPGLRFSLPAGGEVERGRFVSVNSDSTGVQATSTTPIIGASMNKAAAGEVLEVADGIVMVQAAENITAGAQVYSNDVGQVVATAGEGASVAGVAITASAAGGYVAVKIN